MCVCVYVYSCLSLWPCASHLWGAYELAPNLAKDLACTHRYTIPRYQPLLCLMPFRLQLCPVSLTAPLPATLTFSDRSAPLLKTINLIYVYTLSHLCPGTWAVGVPRRRSQRSTSRQGCSWSGSGPEAGSPQDCSNGPQNRAHTGRATEQREEGWGEAKGNEMERRMIRLRTTIYFNVCASLHKIVYTPMFIHIRCVSVPTRLLMAEAHSMRLGNPMISLDSASVCSRGLGRPVYDTQHIHTPFQSERGIS
jgi:hypothetical protein